MVTRSGSDDDSAELRDTEPDRGPDTLQRIIGDKVRDRLFHQPIDAESIGRYEILDIIGEGGMGLVYRARDPELDREVAIKVMLEHAQSEPERLRREAQAMAALSHPNVVEVFEVGVDDGRMFVAMEYLPGENMRQWLKTSPSPDAVLDRVLEAGQGLAAAHMAGLLHRDIKPSNIYIADDGRARLLDFGLARGYLPSTSELRSGGLGPTLSASNSAMELASSELADPLTDTGLVMGTPPYMAPEQLRGEPASENTDLFSFCATAYQALLGVHPFNRRPPVVSSGTLPLILPEGALGPRLQGLQVVLARGLHADPDQRWTSMGELLEALRHAARPVSRFRGAWGPLAVAAATLALLFLQAPAEPSVPGPCDEFSDLSEQWNANERKQLHDVFLANEHPRAKSAWTRIERALDSHTRAWTQARDEACTAGSGPVLEARLDCLADQRRALTAVVEVLGDADGTIIDRVVELERGFDAPERCNDPQFLDRQPKRPTDAETLEPLLEGRALLARFVANARAGRIAEAMALATALDDAVEATSYPPFAVDVDLAVGRTLADYERRDEARPRLERAFFAAQAEQLPRPAFEAALRLAHDASTTQRNPEQGRQWLRHMQATQQQLGDDPILRARVLGQEAAVLQAEGKLDDALAVWRRTIDQLEPHRDAEPVFLSQARGGLGYALVRAGRLKEAEPELSRALEIRTEVFGVEHPSCIKPLVNLAAVLDDLDRHDDALEHLDRALRLLEVSGERQGAQAVGVLQNRALVLRDLKRLDEALANLEEARVIAQREIGPESMNVARVENNLSMVLRRLGRRDEGIAALRRSIEIRRGVLGPDHPALLPPTVNLAAVLMDADAIEDAAPLMADALRIVQSEGEVSQAMVLIPASNLARRQGNQAEATTRARRAIDLLERSEAQVSHLARARLALAETLHAQGRHPEALSSARQARDELQPVRNRSDDVWDMVTGWLQEHDAP
ncbi:MAG: serine/threonine-protein kinase [Myxococcota bacterium]